MLDLPPLIGYQHLTDEQVRQVRMLWPRDRQGQAAEYFYEIERGKIVDRYKIPTWHAEAREVEGS
jgi:hypothetical protein